MKAVDDNRNPWTLPVVFAAGVVVGIMLSGWFAGGGEAERSKPARAAGSLQQEAPAPSAAVAARRPPVRRPATSAGDARDAAVVVSVLDALGREQSRIVTGRLGSSGVLVLPLPALQGAAALMARDRFGSEQPITGVVAFDRSCRYPWKSIPCIWAESFSS